MATHSSGLAWRIPGTGSLVGCRLWGCTESDTTEAMQQQGIYTESRKMVPRISPLQGSSGETDMENRILDTGRGEKRVRCMERVTWKLTLPCVK